VAEQHVGLALAGWVAEVAAVEEDIEDRVHIAVGPEAGPPGHRVLVAGVGDLFSSGDGFEPEAAGVSEGRVLRWASVRVPAARREQPQYERRALTRR
jgi:hypothetical protein